MDRCAPSDKAHLRCPCSTSFQPVKQEWRKTSAPSSWFHTRFPTAPNGQEKTRPWQDARRLPPFSVLPVSSRRPFVSTFSRCLRDLHSSAQGNTSTLPYHSCSRNCNYAWCRTP